MIENIISATAITPKHWYIKTQKSQKHILKSFTEESDQYRIFEADIWQFKVYVSDNIFFLY